MGGVKLMLLIGLLAVVAVTGAVVVFYQFELGRARKAAGEGSLIADTRSGPIEYGESGAGPLLLSIHGAGGGFDHGLANAIDVVGDGYHIIAPSRFGYLRTPVPADVSAAAQADAHAALLSRLNIPRVIVVGVSAGARSAIELALRHPDLVSALILISPATYSPTSPVAIEASRGSRFAFRLVNHGADFIWWAAERIAPSMLVRFIGVPPELLAAAPNAERARVIDIIRMIEPLSQRFPGINIDSVPQLHELPLQQITAPTLIVVARDDGFNTLPAAAFAAERIAAARLVVYDTGGHLLVGHQIELRATVRDFLAKAQARELAEN